MLNKIMLWSSFLIFSAVVIAKADDVVISQDAPSVYRPVSNAMNQRELSQLQNAAQNNDLDQDKLMATAQSIHPVKVVDRSGTVGRAPIPIPPIPMPTPRPVRSPHFPTVTIDGISVDPRFVTPLELQQLKNLLDLIPASQLAGIKSMTFTTTDVSQGGQAVLDNGVLHIILEKPKQNMDDDPIYKEVLFGIGESVFDGLGTDVQTALPHSLGFTSPYLFAFAYASYFQSSSTEFNLLNQAVKSDPPGSLIQFLDIGASEGAITDTLYIASLFSVKGQPLTQGFNWDPNKAFSPIQPVTLHWSQSQNYGVTNPVPVTYRMTLGDNVVQFDGTTRQVSLVANNKTDGTGWSLDVTPSDAFEVPTAIVAPEL